MHPELPFTSARRTPRPARAQRLTKPSSPRSGTGTDTNERTNGSGKIRQRAGFPSAPCPLRGNETTYALTRAGSGVDTPESDPWHAETLAIRLWHQLDRDAWERLALAVGRVGLGIEEYLRTRLQAAA